MSVWQQSAQWSTENLWRIQNINMYLLKISKIAPLHSSVNRLGLQSCAFLGIALLYQRTPAHKASLFYSNSLYHFVKPFTCKMILHHSLLSFRNQIFQLLLEWELRQEQISKLSLGKRQTWIVRWQTPSALLNCLRFGCISVKLSNIPWETLIFFSVEIQHLSRNQVLRSLRVER